MILDDMIQGHNLGVPVNRSNESQSKISRMGSIGWDGQRHSLVREFVAITSVIFFPSITMQRFELFEQESLRQVKRGYRWNIVLDVSNTKIVYLDRWLLQNIPFQFTQPLQNYNILWKFVSDLKDTLKKSFCFIWMWNWYFYFQYNNCGLITYENLIESV